MIKSLLARPQLYLSEKMCRDIYERFKSLIDFEEPLPPFECRYPNSLESALSSIAGSYEGENFCPTVLDAAAAYYYKIACGHIFLNGNKRLGILFTDIFLYLHDIDFSLPEKRLYLLTEELAALSWKGTNQKIVEKIARQIICDVSKDIKM